MHISLLTDGVRKQVLMNQKQILKHMKSPGPSFLGGSVAEGEERMGEAGVRCNFYMSVSSSVVKPLSPYISPFACTLENAR